MNMRFVLSLCCLLSIAACTEHEADFNDPIPVPADADNFRAQFNPTAGKIPFPSNLLFTGSTDGTLNIPASASDSAGAAALKTMLNTLDGFSTTTSWTATLVGDIDSDTVVGGSTVHFYAVSAGAINTGYKVTAVTSELTYGVDYALSTSAVGDGTTTLIITPLKPLQAKSTYMAVLTDGIKTTSGDAIASDQTYFLAKGGSSLLDGNGHNLVPALLAAAGGSQAAADALAASLEPLRQQIRAMEDAAVAYAETNGVGPTRDDIVLAWTATTQSTSDVLAQVKSTTTAKAITVANTGLTTTAFQATLPGVANVYIGTLDVPYYLDIAAPTTGYWNGESNSILTRYNKTPAAKTTETVPLILTIPNVNSGQSKPAGGWPVVIFQHGVTRQRTDMIAVADGLAAAGFAVIAIDMPLHGLTDATSPIHANNTVFLTDKERIPNVDNYNNTTGAAGADGLTDTTGMNYINLSSLLTSRDNVRQSVSDLFTLSASLGNVDIDSNSVGDLDTAKIHFLGHSLGGIVGSVFLALDPSVKASALASPGGGLAKLLDGSPAFSTSIANGLAAAGIVEGTATYEAFMATTQQILDSADPINYAGDIATAGAQTQRGIYISEIVGDGTDGSSDQVVPNTVIAGAYSFTTAPLSGTEPLVKLAGASNITATTNPTLPWVGIARFTKGGHGSLIDPTAHGSTQDDAASLAVTQEMQREIASFFVSNGAQVTVTNASVLKTN